MSTVKSILIDDRNRPAALEPLSRFMSFMEWNLCGSSFLERTRSTHPEANIYYACDDSHFLTLILNRYPFILPYNNIECEQVFSSASYLPWELQRVVTSLIEDELSQNKNWKKFRKKYQVKSNDFSIVGKEKHLYLHPSASVYPGVVFDTTTGPILIDENVKISPFSFLEGPLYIGKETSVDNARITGGTLIGKNCRLGGEIENSIILDYTNKHHEGFLGHSFVSAWVNLGALSTTSDLKNNYGIIKLNIATDQVNTGTIKFGSIIAPFSKIGIGVMLNTGSVIDIGSNLIESRIGGYSDPFTWTKKNNYYRLEEFLNDTRKIMARRGINLFDYEEIYLRSLYSRLVESKV